MEVEARRSFHRWLLQPGCDRVAADDIDPVNLLQSRVEAQGEEMRERRIRIQELETNPSGCLEEVRSGTMLLLVDGGHRVAPFIPEPGASAPKNDSAIAWSGRRLKTTKARARLPGGGTMADIVKENRR